MFPPNPKRFVPPFGDNRDWALVSGLMIGFHRSVDPPGDWDAEGSMRTSCSPGWEDRGVVLVEIVHPAGGRNSRRSSRRRYDPWSARREGTIERREGAIERSGPTNSLADP